MVARGRLVRGSALVGLSLLLVLTAGCGEDSSQPEEFAPERGGTNLTLTSRSCAYEGVSRVWRGPVEFVVANDGDEEGAFEVVRISEGASFADLDRYIAEENERLAVGRAVRGEPSFVSVVSQLEVPATENAVLTTELGPGRYAVLCFTGYPTSAIYAVAPLDVRPVRLSSTGGACVYEGPKSISPGPLSIDIENDGDDVQRFELLQEIRATTGGSRRYLRRSRPARGGGAAGAR